MTRLIVDPLFPQIPTVLEAELMCEFFQNALNSNRQQGSRHLRVEKCEVGEKRYKPGKRFMLSYRLKLQDLETNDSFDQVMTASLGSLGSKPLTVSENGDYAPIGIPSVSYLSELDMMLWAFPYDRKLSHLPKLLDDDRLRIFFTENKIAFNLSSSEQVTSVKSEVVHYLPEQSCMIRYTLVIVDRAFSNGFKEIIVYGKNYRDESGYETYNIMRELTRQTGNCAAPLYYDADLKTLWQVQVPGAPFEWTNELSEAEDRIRAVAGCIASFHRSKVPSSRRYGFRQINDQLDEATRIAVNWNATLGKKVQETVTVLLDSQNRMNWDDTDCNSPLHLDLKMGNILVSGNKAYLIDMDCVSLGDSLADTGSFIANLYLNGLRAGAVLPEIDKVVAVFIREYRIAVGSNFDMPKLNWYIAAALIHEVLRRSLRQQNQERLKYLDAYIDLSCRYHTMCLEGIEHV